MANELVKFEDMPQLPAELQRELEENSNLVPIETIPSLSYEGKVWTISIDGKKTQLMRKGQDDELEPIAMFKGVILDYAKNRGRAYYSKGYDPKKAAMPDCWSDDGQEPSEHVRNPVCKICKDCPNAVKGSKVTEQGKEVTACGQFRMVAIVPASKLDFEPLRLKIAITSDWDGQRPDGDQWYGFSNFTSMLKQRGVPHTAMITVKMKFDPAVQYPKVLFSKGDWLTTEQINQLVPIIKSDKVKDLISKSWTPNGVDGHRHGDEEEVAQEEAASEQPAAVTKEEDEGDIMLPGEKAPAPAPNKPANKPATTTTKPNGANGGAKPAAKPETVKPAQKASGGSKPAQAAAQEVDDEMAQLLGEWGGN